MTGSTPSPTRSASLLRRFRDGIGELFRFGAVGIVAFVIDVGVFNALVHLGSPGVLVGPTVDRQDHLDGHCDGLRLPSQP